nr:unnamed protein product [Callosobruchus chinensis]
MFWKRINYLGSDWRCCQYRLPFLITVLQTVIFISLSILQYDENLWNIVLFTKVNFTTYAQVLHCDVICVLILLIKSKVVKVNESLLTKEVKGKQLKKVINFYNELHDFIHQFSGFFSWQILLIFLACFLNLLYIIGVKMLHADDDRIASTTWRLVTAIPVTYSLVGPLAITFCCDSTANECRKIIEICFALEQSADYTAEDKQELKVLVEQSTVNPVTFTAAGFFEINRSNMLSFFSSTATYLIVFIQLKNQ